MNAHSDHGPLAGGLHAADAAALTTAATRLSVAMAVVLVGVKAYGWIVSGSVGMMASLGDSFLDLVAALTTFFAVRYAIEPPDAEHRFGHGKAEAFASLVQAGLVFASGALIGREAFVHILHPQPVGMELLGMAIMVGSTLAVGALVWVQTGVLAKTGSVAVHGDRAHYLADIVCNVSALIGLIGSLLFHQPIIDALAGLFVAGWLIWGAVGVFREAANQLMDKELGETERDMIKRLAKEDPRVLGVHQLRSRAAGPFIHLQMHMDLEPSLTLEQAHQVMVAAERRILTAFPAADVLIHPDPSGRAEPHGGAFPEHHEASDPGTGMVSLH
jgi:cation diffusion facilitator family transporter